MTDLNELLTQNPKRLDTADVSNLLTQQLLREQLNGETATDLTCCQSIFAALADEPVVLAPALAKENQALLAQIPAAAPILANAAANQPWYKRLQTQGIAALMLGIVAAIGVGIYKAQDYGTQLAEARAAKARAVAMEEYLKAHREQFNANVQNASIRVTY